MFIKKSSYLFSKISFLSISFSLLFQFLFLSISFSSYLEFSTQTNFIPFLKFFFPQSSFLILSSSFGTFKNKKKWKKSSSLSLTRSLSLSHSSKSFSSFSPCFSCWKKLHKVVDRRTKLDVCGARGTRVRT